MNDADKRLLEALSKLDPENDEHWTENGSPAMKAVEEFYGTDVTRKAVVGVAPLFTREQAKAGAKPGGEAIPTVDPKIAAPAEVGPVMADDTAEADQITVDEPVFKRDEMPADEVAAARQQLAIYDEELAAIEVEIDEINARKSELNKKRDELVKKLDSGGQESFSTQFQGWIAGQMAEREARANHAELANALQKSGILGQSVIDAAFARRTKRGGQRPVHPLITPTE